MRARRAEQRSYGSNRRIMSIAGLVIIGLLALGLAFAQAHKASASEPIVPTGSPGRLTLLGPSAGQLATGPDSALPSGKGQTGDLPGGSAFLPHLPRPGSATNKGDAGSMSGSGAVPAAVASPTCSPNWVPVSSPDAAFNSTLPLAVAEIGPNDVWAGGCYQSDASTSLLKPFFEHWDGSTWSLVRAPLPTGSRSGEIWDIAEVSSNNVWAVGNYSDGTNSFELLENWNGLQWSTFTGANPSTTDNELYGVVALSANNVWAVGFNTQAGVTKTLIEQWNGTSWLQVTSPSYGTGNNALLDISVVPGSSGSDMWAVGYYTTAGGVKQTLTLHYVGSNWTYVAGADQGAGNNELWGVTAISTADVWATGDYYVGTVQHTLAEHWNGSLWTTSPTLDPGGQANQFIRVFATASNNVWAVGLAQDTSSSNGLIEHWNGSAWSISPHTIMGGNSFDFAISGSSSSDIWTVGLYIAPTSNYADALTEHYNGTAWGQVYAPDAPTSSNVLYSVSPVSANDIWAVGYAYGYKSAISVDEGIIEHWDGTAWSHVASPHPGQNDDSLFAVKAVSANDVWAVGYYVNTNHWEQTLIVHWNGTAWSRINSPNPGGSNNQNELSGVDAESANDAWAVGDYYVGGTDESLILHWNGTAWLKFNSQNPGAFSNILASVAVVPGTGGNDAWAVGEYQNTNGGRYLPLFERWNGSAWTNVSVPNVGGVDNEVNRVFALSANDAWAVGYTIDSTSHLNQNLAFHWDGVSWTLSPVMQQGPYSNTLAGVRGTASDNVYAFGAYYDAASPPQPHILLEHWNGSAWGVTPSSPNPGFGAAFSDMVIFSSADMWAVGGYLPFRVEGDAATLAEQFQPCVSSCNVTFTDMLPALRSTLYPLPGLPGHHQRLP